MFNKAEFNAQIARKELRKLDVARALNIDVSTLYRKIENDGDFDRDQINTLIKLLDIKDPKPIFFADELT